MAVSYVFPTLGNAAAGLISTVEDMYRWSQALYSSTLVSPASMEEIFMPAKDGYGYGWEICEAPYGMSAEHDGSVDGFVSYIGLYPDREATIIVLSNFALACAPESMLANILFQ